MVAKRKNSLFMSIVWISKNCGSLLLFHHPYRLDIRRTVEGRNYSVQNMSRYPFIILLLTHIYIANTNGNIIYNKGNIRGEDVGSSDISLLQVRLNPIHYQMN